MKQTDYRKMYGATPESFQRRVASALKQTEAKPMKRKRTVRTVLITATLLILLTAAAFAAFSSQVTAFFGKMYGKDTQNWLEKGDVATVNQSFTLDGVAFSIDEVVYRDNGLYGLGTISPQAGGNIVIIPEDHTPDEPYGYDIYGESGKPEEAPADAPTIADMVREKGSRLLVVRALPDQIGVDGGEMLSPETVGCAFIPQRDGSIRFSFEVSDAIAVEEGQTYTILMWASVCDMTVDGKTLEDTRHGEYWTVEITPEPIGDIH